MKIKLVKRPYSVDEAKKKAEENVHKKGEENLMRVKRKVKRNEEGKEHLMRVIIVSIINHFIFKELIFWEKFNFSLVFEY